ncbi:cobalamin-binding protein [Candidatus Bathyarchaeota archaeon]|nr:cobalamin-binding protein [Candidatus Bathyarchaeota archaeon]
MNKQEILAKIANSLAELDSETLKTSLEDALQKKISVQDIIREGLGKGMEIVGERYDRGEYFLSELIMAGVTMREGMVFIEPYIKGQTSETRGKILIGTVEGDLHDIGKNIVATMLRSAEFEVHDLGVDVSPDTFVKKTKELKPDIIALSALLSVTIGKVKETINAISDTSLRKDLKIIIGGSCLNPRISKELGADAFGRDAWDGVNQAKQLISS